MYLVRQLNSHTFEAVAGLRKPPEAPAVAQLCAHGVEEAIVAERGQMSSVLALLLVAPTASSFANLKCVSPLINQS